MKLLWSLQMAWRDSRKNRGRLLLFMSSIVLGIAALVAINSFGDNLRTQVNNEAKSLLAADLKIDSRQPIPEEIISLIDSLRFSVVQEISFGSMVVFEKSGHTRLVNVRAVSTGFPIFGKLVTMPPSAATGFHRGNKALVDRTIMLQFGAKDGDSIRIGNSRFIIEGTVMKVPGQAGIVGSVAPPVFIPVSCMDATGLIQRGSRINYTAYLEYSDNNGYRLAESVLKPRLDKAELNYEDVTKRKALVGNAFSDLTGFLNLTAFIALLLGCIGVAGSVHIYMKEKVASVAILRCLGASANRSMNIFLVQIFLMSLIGSLIGAVLGTLIQFALPVVFADFLPLEIKMQISIPAIATGVATGVAAAMLFALFPLLEIRNISPLKAIRASFEPRAKKRDSWIAWLFIALFIVIFAWLQLDTWKRALVFSLALTLSFGVLAAFAGLVMRLTRKYFPVRSSFTLRQGLSGLYRPGNQTLILMVTIGLGTILITSLWMSRQLLLDKLEMTSSNDERPNMVIFDIQDSDLESVKQTVEQEQMPVIATTPIVSMRLHALKDRTVAELRKDSLSEVNSWVLDREYRVTYRDSLTDAENIISGSWHGSVNNPSDTIFISVSENFVDDMKVGLGDAVTFNVQGAMVRTIVGSIRKVDFQRIQPNFVVLFPAGVLEEAPKFHVVVTRFSTPEQSASFQRAVVLKFPNVSIIDLNLILQTVDDVLKKVSFIIQFMALFSIFTGIVVLIGSVILSKYQRIRESVLLRTLGASRRRIFGINLVEYFFLGSLASLTGIAISVVLNMALAHFSFNAILTPDLLPLVLSWLFITMLTVIIGLLNSREVVNKTPLEVLRM